MLTAQQIKIFLETEEAVRLPKIHNIDRILEHANINESQITAIESVFDSLLTTLEKAAQTEAGYSIVIRHLTHILDNNASFEAITSSLTKISDEENQDDFRFGLLFLASLARDDRYEVHNHFLSRQGETNSRLSRALKITASRSLQALKNDLCLNKTEESIQHIILARTQIEDARQAPVFTRSLSAHLSIQSVLASLTEFLGNALNSVTTSLRTTTAAEISASNHDVSNPVEKYIAAAIHLENLKHLLFQEISSYATTLSLFAQVADAPFTIQRADLLLGDFYFNLFLDLQHYENTWAQLQAISSTIFTARLRHISPNIPDELLGQITQLRDNYKKAFESLVAARRDVNTLFENSHEVETKAMRRIFLTRGRTLYDLTFSALIPLGLEPDQISVMIKSENGLSSPLGTEAFFIEFSVLGVISNAIKAIEIMECERDDNFPFDPDHYAPLPTQDFHALFNELLSEEERLAMASQPTESTSVITSMASLMHQNNSFLPHQDPDDSLLNTEQQNERFFTALMGRIQSSNAPPNGEPDFEQLSVLMGQLGLFRQENASPSSSDSSDELSKRSILA